MRFLNGREPALPYLTGDEPELSGARERRITICIEDAENQGYSVGYWRRASTDEEWQFITEFRTDLGTPANDHD